MITVQQLITQANSRVQTLSVEQAAGLLSEDGVVFVDLRDSAEIARDGRIPGALHVSRGMLEFALDPATPYHQGALANARQIILYCASGGRSALAADTAQSMGVAGVSHLAGGFKAWVAAGYPRLDGSIA